MAFTIYRSSDASAPTLSGTAGDLVNVLDKCLVAGYGAKAAAGWTKDYTGVNKATFRAPSGSQLYLRVQDDGPGAGGAKEARITGYETMSDVDTGTGPFPTAAQGVGGVAMVPVRKSTSADATTRTWLCAADARTFYMFVKTGDSAAYYLSFMFGEIYSFVTSDAYNCMICGRTVENNGTTTNERLDYHDYPNSPQSQTWMARLHTGLGTSVNVGKHGQGGISTIPGALYGVVPFTNPSDGGLYLTRLSISDSASGHIRGRMRGFWHFMHAATNVTDGDTFSGAGDLAGKTFLFLKLGGNGGVFVIETSDTLETN